MRNVNGGYDLTASDLVGYLNCHHLAALERGVADGALKKPYVHDPLLRVLWERGLLHEQSYVEHLAEAGLESTRIEGIEVTAAAVAETVATMKKGVQVVIQGALSQKGWVGRADILRRVEKPSVLGSWSYEAIDTKLARETKAGAVLQLCLYSDLITGVQGLAPEFMSIVVPGSDFEPQQYRFADFSAYYRRVRREFTRSLSAAPQNRGGTYPDPIEHCDICGWRMACEQRRRKDDHLCLVAGISKLQINELTERGFPTMKRLAEMPLPLEWKPRRGSATTYARTREQARMQVETREAGEVRFELLAVEPGFELAQLPEPSDGDIVLDFEGDPFAGDHGLEYLIGYGCRDDSRTWSYRHVWGLSLSAEKRAFESFIDFVMDRWARFPDLHIYHYAPYEPAALKRLMGRHATREEELDRILRAKLFVDLYQIVRRRIRAGVENYSIKRLEPIYAFERAMPLPDANAALAVLQANLELGDAASISEEAKAAVVAYNLDDCRSARALRDWLEEQRRTLVDGGTPVPRPAPGDGSPTENITDWLIRINAVIPKLTADIPDDPSERTQEQQARWILANVIDWHRREDKAVWWEYFRLADLSAEDLLDEQPGLSGTRFHRGGRRHRTCADLPLPFSSARNRDSGRRRPAQCGGRPLRHRRSDLLRKRDDRHQKAPGHGGPASRSRLCAQLCQFQGHGRGAVADCDPHRGPRIGRNGTVFGGTRPAAETSAEDRGCPSALCRRNRSAGSRPAVRHLKRGHPSNSGPSGCRQNLHWRSNDL